MKRISYYADAIFKPDKMSNKALIYKRIHGPIYYLSKAVYKYTISDIYSAAISSKLKRIDGSYRWNRKRRMSDEFVTTKERMSDYK